MSTVRLLVAMVAATLAAVASAQTYYKWVDAQGVTHYSEQAPAKTRAQTVQVHGDTPVTAPAEPATVAAPAKVASELDAAKDEFRKQACATARNNLRLLSGSAMVLDTGALQSPDNIATATRLTAEQRTAATAEAQQHIAQYCDRG